jgi:lipopolysaccharide export system protein LptA
MTLRSPRTRLSRKTALRAGVGLPLVALAGFAASQQLEAQVFPGHNTDAPVDYAADRIELQDKQDRVVLSGNVDIRQAELRLRAARTVVNFTDQGQLRLQRITASGGVTVTRGNEVATGDTAVYDFNQRIITMVGNASLKRDGDTLRGGRFVIDLRSGVSTASGGRVSGTFSVPKRN